MKIPAWIERMISHFCGFMFGISMSHDAYGVAILFGIGWMIWTSFVAGEYKELKSDEFV